LSDNKRPGINLQLLLISIIGFAIITTFSISITNMPNNTYVKYAQAQNSPKEKVQKQQMDQQQTFLQQ
jgi:hypothetical protein